MRVSRSPLTPVCRYSDVIVFVIGGGCYMEYYNLQELLSHKMAAAGGAGMASPGINTTIGTQYFPRHVYYGCTELVNGDRFLDQLTSLGNAQAK